MLALDSDGNTVWIQATISFYIIAIDIATLQKDAYMSFLYLFWLLYVGLFSYAIPITCKQQIAFHKAVRCHCKWNPKLIHMRVIFFHYTQSACVDKSCFDSKVAAASSNYRM